ncbi:YceI family protein [Corallibacter sp.]|uniref:YceI family protein n=1 Tax=Corallibacter sp. TaxID=2038084 RepID=UPI003A8E4425
MKRKFLTVFTIASIAFGLTSCKDKAQEANTSEAEPAAVSESVSQKYVTDVAQSSIEWKGFKPTGTHNGTVSIDTGVFQTNDGQLQSGTFLIDMNTIKVLDGDEKMQASLESHLKGTVEDKKDHFFNVNQFPTGAFEITGVESMAAGKTNLSGNLSLKGMKHNISFPVTITNEGDKMTISSEAFTIDRTKWNINYGSKSVFEDLGDKFINDDIELKINIVAFKKA